MKHNILLVLFFLTFSFISAQSIKLDQDKYSSVIYPNPASTSFTIKFDNPSKAISISLYSIIGNEVMNKKVDKNDKISFNIQNLKKGKYIVRIINNDGTTETQSLIKN